MIQTLRGGLAMPLDAKMVSPFSKLQGVDPADLQVFHTLFRAMRLHRQLMFKMIASQEIPPGQAGCLWIVSNHEGITQRELAEILHVAPSTVTVMLQKMEAAGIISRKTDADDQRLTRIYMTQEGEQLQKQMNGILAQFINTVFGRMENHDREELNRLLNMLCTNISQEL